MDDIRADEDRGNCAVKIVLYVKGFLRLLVALIEPRLEPNAADGRGGRLCHGKNTPPCREENDRYPRQPTVAVREGVITLHFYIVMTEYHIVPRASSAYRTLRRFCLRKLRLGARTARGLARVEGPDLPGRLDDGFGALVDALRPVLTGGIKRAGAALFAAAPA